MLLQPKVVVFWLDQEHVFLVLDVVDAQSPVWFQEGSRFIMQFSGLHWRPQISIEAGEWWPDRIQNVYKSNQHFVIGGGFIPEMASPSTMVKWPFRYKPSLN